MNRKLVARLLATASVIASAFGVAAPANAPDTGQAQHRHHLG